LIVTDLPAPLSPASAVTLPGGTSKLIRVNACTGPNRLVTPRSSNSGAPFELLGAGAGSVAGLSEVLIVLPV
jgi:hypothetical protein